MRPPQAPTAEVVAPVQEVVHDGNGGHRGFPAWRRISIVKNTQSRLNRDFKRDPIGTGARLAGISDSLIAAAAASRARIAELDDEGEAT
jgi:hypothetical protein